MADPWLPGAERNVGNNAGPMDGDGSRKLLLHDTEGSTIGGAVGAYQANNSWPHLTVDCRRRKVQQHLPFNVAARALRNESGGVQTNREGRYLVQIELVGFANNRDGSIFGSLADYDWFGSVVVGPICRGLGIPLRSTVQWVRYPDSYGKHAPQRLSGAAWDAYEGILAHQHAPENSHGDTGTIDITRILRAAAGGTTPVQEDDDMPTLPEMAKALNTPGDPYRIAHGASIKREFASAEFKAALRDVLAEQEERPMLVWAGGPVYVLDSDRQTKRQVRGWENVDIEVWLGTRFDGLFQHTDGRKHPKPFDFEQDYLDSIDTVEPDDAVEPAES